MDQANRELDRELWNPAIDWLLNVAPVELGATGTLESVIAALEHGGEATGVPNTTPFSDHDFGWCVGDSPASKWRKLAPLWFALSLASQGVHLAHYTSRNDIPDTQRAAVEGALGKLARAALWVHEGEKLANLIEACVDKAREGRKPLIASAVKRTENAVRAAHREWDALFLSGAPERMPAISMVPEPDGPTSERWERDYAKRRKERPQWEETRAAEVQVVGLLCVVGFVRALDAERRGQDLTVKAMARGLRALYRKPREKALDAA